MRLKKVYEMYHPDDKGSWNGSRSCCGGMDEYINDHPGFLEWLKEKYPSSTGKQNLELYIEFQPDDFVEIHPVRVEDIGAIILAKAELRFQKLALLAQKSLNTNDEENKILHLKEAILCLAKYKGHCVAQLLETYKVTESTSFGVLRQLPDNIKEYVVDEDEHIIGCVPMPYHRNEKLYILVPSIPDAAPPLRLMFDGKNFIAAYTQNLPPKLMEKGLLQLEAAPTELPGVYPPYPEIQAEHSGDIEERMHGDVMEHRHVGTDYDYWHPANRVHKED
jgi:hypothetical protein